MSEPTEVHQGEAPLEKFVVDGEDLILDHVGPKLAATDLDDVFSLHAEPEEVTEALWVPRLHPRGRGGKFIDAPDIQRDNLTADDELRGPPELDAEELDRPRGPVTGPQAVRLAQDAIKDDLDIVFGSQTGIEEQNVQVLAAKGDKITVAYPAPSGATEIVRDLDPKTTFLGTSSFVLPESERFPQPKLSDKVKAISSPEDANAYLKSIGVEDVDLSPPDTPVGRKIRENTVFFQQIAQAVTDAQEKFPSLRNGMQPLKGIKLWTNVKNKGDTDRQKSMAQGTWATTAGNPDDPKNPDQANMFAYPMPRSGTYIILNDFNSKFTNRNDSVSLGELGGTAIVDQNPYGRMMHELGHAVASSTGFSFYGDPTYGEDNADFDKREQPEIVVMGGANFSPDNAEAVSSYAASSPAEAWAEVFTVLNTEGGLERYSKKTQTAMKRLQKAANDYGKKEGIGNLL